MPRVSRDLSPRTTTSECSILSSVAAREGRPAGRALDNRCHEGDCPSTRRMRPHSARRFALTLVSALLVALAATSMVQAGNPPPGATAQCNDGTYSSSHHHSGTCSHHGGVAVWLDGSGTGDGGSSGH